MAYYRRSSSSTVEPWVIALCCGIVLLLAIIGLVRRYRKNRAAKLRTELSTATVASPSYPMVVAQPVYPVIVPQPANQPGFINSV